MHPALVLALALPLALAPGEAPAQARGPAPPAPPTMPATPPPPTMPDTPPPLPSIPDAAPIPLPVPAPTQAETPDPPVMPLAPPAAPVIPPPIAVPTRPAPPPPQVEVAADAPGTAERLPGGLRVTFGPGSAVLNPATHAALRDLARGLPATGSVTVAAFAPGTPEDPSTARRLSLARALAARNMLIGEGIASPRVLVRALGASDPIAEGPPDRVDILPAPPPSQPRPAP